PPPPRPPPPLRSQPPRPAPPPPPRPTPSQPSLPAPSSSYSLLDGIARPLRHDAYHVGGNLHEPACYMITTDPPPVVHGQPPLPHQRHERGVPGEDADEPVEGRNDHSSGFPVVYRSVGADQRAAHQVAA